MEKPDTITKIIPVRPCTLAEDVPGEVYKRVCPFKGCLETKSETKGNHTTIEYTVYCSYDPAEGYCGFRGDEINITVNVED